MSTVVEPKDMTLPDIKAEISKLTATAHAYADEDDVYVRDANRLGELRRETAKRDRANLSTASRTGKIKEITITPETPSEQLSSHAPSTNVIIAKTNMEADNFPAAQTWDDRYLRELRNPSTELRAKQKDLLDKNRDLNKKYKQLEAVNRYIIANFLVKDKESIMAFTKKPENVEHIRTVFAERAGLMAELGYADDRYDSITKNKAYKNNFDAIKNGLFGLTGGGKSKSKKRKRRRKRKSKKTIKHK
jgi:hypothetical protein